MDPSLIKSFSQSPLPLAIIPAQLWRAFTSRTTSPLRLVTPACMCWVVISSHPWVWYLPPFLRYITPTAFVMNLKLNFNFILTTFYLSFWPGSSWETLLKRDVNKRTLTLFPIEKKYVVLVIKGNVSVLFSIFFLVQLYRHISSKSTKLYHIQAERA